MQILLIDSNGSSDVYTSPAPLGLNIGNIEWWYLALQKRVGQSRVLVHRLQRLGAFAKIGDTLQGSKLNQCYYFIRRLLCRVTEQRALVRFLDESMLCEDAFSSRFVG